MVPAEAAWARYVLLAIVWFFVLAVLTGPVERWLRARKTRDLPRSRPRW
jgi:predicted PurR-regulated permease PerM